MHIEISPLMRSALDAMIARLADEFRGVFSRETVMRCVQESFERVGERPTVGAKLPAGDHRAVRTRAAVGGRTVTEQRRKGAARGPVRV